LVASKNKYDTRQKKVMFCWCFCVSFKIVDHGGRQGNTSQALTQWRHSVASSEVRGVLHRVMRPALYRRIPVVIKMASNLPELFVVVDLVVSNNHS
jgi:hypothetical protein